MVALLGVSLLLAAGLALDLGLYYSGNRDLRAATEAAALAAAMKPGNAQQRAAAYFRNNGYPDGSLKSLVVTQGYYCADKNINVVGGGSRFVTAAQGCPGSVQGQNAVRVTATKLSKQFLTGLFGSASPIPELSTTASAARIDEAGIAATSDFLNLTAGGVTSTLLNAVNGLLGALLGNKPLNLTAPDIYALMRHNVDVAKFLDALAPTGFSGTYGQLINQNYDIRDIATAASKATDDSATKLALSSFATMAPPGYMVPLGNLISIGVWKNMPTGSSGPIPGPGLRVGMNAYQLISFAAQAGGGAIDLSDAVSLLVPDSTVAIRAVTSGAMSRPRFAFGPAGETTVGTSVLRLQVDVQVTKLSVLDIVDAKASVPLLIDIGAATATIPAGGIDCDKQSDQRNKTSISLNVTYDATNIYLGKLVNSNVMSKTMPTIKASDFDYADLFKLKVQILFIGLDVASVQGKATIQPLAAGSAVKQLGSGGKDSLTPPGQTSTSILPSQYGVVAGKLQVGATVQSLNSSLFSTGGLKACTLSLICLNTNDLVLKNSLSNVLTTVSGVLSNVADPLLDNVLGALGIQLGTTTVWTTGSRCGVPVLI
jgi:uncharacterized membrane protein